MTDTSEQVEVLVLGSDEGELYAIPAEMLEEFRVPEDMRPEIEAGRVEEDEVSGHNFRGVRFQPNQSYFSNLAFNQNRMIIGQDSGSFRGSSFRGWR